MPYQMQGIGGSDSILVTYDPSGGSDTAQLVFHLVENGIHRDTTVMVYGAGPSQVGAEVSIKSERKVISSGEAVDIPIYIATTPATATLTTSLALPFSIDANVFSDVSFLPTTSRVSGTVSNTGTVSLDLQSFAVNGSTLLGTLHCKAYLSTTLRSSITLGKSSIASSEGNCLTLTNALNSVDLEFTGCGDSTLLHFMATGVALRIERIVPNPAKSEIRVEGIGLRVEGLEVYDQLGRKIPLPQPLPQAGGEFSGHGLPQAGGENDRVVGGDPAAITLDVRNVPEGVYYLRIGTASARFVIQR